MTTITRFAPSPTGALHVGGLRTALFAYAYAKRYQGKFLLRLEDTDQKRSSDESAAAILRDLEWAGLTADNIGSIPKQSGRLALYNEAISALEAKGLTYEEDNGAVRFRMGKDITIQDEVFGMITYPGEELEDFIIRKADGFPTFHLAVVVDDQEMGVTHIIRGQEHLTNTPKHAALYDALDYTRPTWVHTPSILNPGGSKMSKRDKAKTARVAAEEANLITVSNIPDTDFQAFMNKDNDDIAIAIAIANELQLQLPEIEVADFRNAGYTPEALNNYLALLGWNPGGDVERFDLAFMCQHFGFERINKAGSIFDRTKLKAFNGERLQQLSSEEYAALLKDFSGAYAPAEPYQRIVESEIFVDFCAAYQPRCQTLAEPFIQAGFLVANDSDISWAFETKPVRKAFFGNENLGLTLLSDFVDTLSALPEQRFGQAVYEAILPHCEANGQSNMGKLAQPLRIAIVGGPVSPDLTLTCDMLGKSACVTRVQNCLAAAAEFLK